MHYQLLGSTLLVIARNRTRVSSNARQIFIEPRALIMPLFVFGQREIGKEFLGGCGGDAQPEKIEKRLDDRCLSGDLGVAWSL